MGEGRLSLSGRGWWGGVGEHFIRGMLSDVHFVIIEGMHEVVSRVWWCMGVDRLVEMGGQEGTMV